MTDKELKERLAKWAGFVEIQPSVYAPPVGYVDKLPSDSVIEVGEPPRFTNDLNACFEQLVPNIPDISTVSIVVFINDKGITYSAFIYTLCGHYTTTEKHYATPALALCRAIEKMIDKEGG